MAADENRAAAQRLRSALDPSAGPERGSRIATLRRREGEELRVTLAEWEGETFVHLRVWRRDSRGRWYPARRGLALRAGELPDVLDALAAAADSLTAQLASHARPQPDGSGAVRSAASGAGDAKGSA